MIRSFVLLAALALASAGAPAQATQKIDPARSYIRFVSKQMSVPVEGRFRKFDAEVAFDRARPEAAKARFEVDLGSIDLGNEEAETEIRRPLWFNIEKFPMARFVAQSVKATGAGTFEARGPLTIKGTSREIVAPFTLAEAGGIKTVEGQFTLKRLQYAVGERHWSDVETVADDVEVRFKFVLNR